MMGLLNILIAGAMASTTPQGADFLPVPGVSDPMYVVAGSIVRGDQSTFATVLTPLEEMGLMSTRLEMDCTARQYRALAISFYNQDGTPRSSIGPDGSVPPSGWFTRKAAEIATVICG